MDAATRQSVRQRAGEKCEYCGISQETVPFASFHIDHIVAKNHALDDSMSNLALACNHCNFHKGPNLASIDPESKQMVPLYNPRKDAWAEHFKVVGAAVIGLTPIGRATVRLLAMNTVDRMELRTE